MMRNLIISLLSILMLHTVVQAQGSLLEQEIELAAMAQDILVHPDLDHKIKVNRKFTKQLMNLLKEPESYNYAWDSLKTVSI
ncbi:MAG: hypothetical protein AAFV07_20680, partial [Bacteroidota bacterium]